MLVPTSARYCTGPSQRRQEDGAALAESRAELARAQAKLESVRGELQLPPVTSVLRRPWFTTGFPSACIPGRTIPGGGTEERASESGEPSEKGWSSDVFRPLFAGGLCPSCFWWPHHSGLAFSLVTPSFSPNAQLHSQR